MSLRRAVSLLEVLCAMSILAVAALAIAQVFISGLGLMTQSRDMQAAAEVGRQLLEQVRVSGTIPPNATFDGSVPDPQVNGFPPAPYPVGTVDGKPYTLVVTTQPVPGSPDVKAVGVEVRWGDNHRARLQTYFYGR